jgi:hypothetical protein
MVIANGQESDCRLPTPRTHFLLILALLILIFILRVTLNDSNYKIPTGNIYISHQMCYISNKSHFHLPFLFTFTPSPCARCDIVIALSITTMNIKFAGACGSGWYLLHGHGIVSCCCLLPLHRRPTTTNYCRISRSLYDDAVLPPHCTKFFFHTTHRPPDSVSIFASEIYY